MPQGFPVTGVVLCDQVKSLDWSARKADLICTGNPTVTADVLAKIKVLLSLP